MNIEEFAEKYATKPYKIKDGWIIAKKIDCSKEGLKEIKFKLNVELLDCSNNKLKKLPELKNVKWLDCSFNKLSKFPELKNVKWLYCNNNKLKKLPELKNVELLDCSNNQLKKLPELKNVKWLYCFNNQLSKLQELKNVKWLYCNNNQLKELPELKYVERLYCSFNKLSKLPELKNVETLYLFGNNVDFYQHKNVANKILTKIIEPKDVFLIDNSEIRRIAYEHLDKNKMKKLEHKIIDETIDQYNNKMTVIEFNINGFDKPFRFLNCFCPSTNREYFIQTNETNCKNAKNRSFLMDEIKFIKEW